MATIICQDCGVRRERVPSNTRYCRGCRLLRDVRYWRRRTRDCKNCRIDFAPLHRTDYYCSKCDPGLESYAGPCRIALDNDAHDGWPAIKDIPVCARCLRNPKQRGRLIGSLTKGRDQRRTANGWSAES